MRPLTVSSSDMVRPVSADMHLTKALPIFMLPQLHTFSSQVHAALVNPQSRDTRFNFGVEQELPRNVFFRYFLGALCWLAGLLCMAIG